MLIELDDASFFDYTGRRQVSMKKLKTASRLSQNQRQKIVLKI